MLKVLQFAKEVKKCLSERMIGVCLSVENFKKKVKSLREEVSSKSLITKILAENINNHKNLKPNNHLYNDFKYVNKNTKSKSCNNNLSNTPEIDFNIRNKFVEEKDARSNVVNFMKSNIPTSNRFNKLRAVENIKNKTKIDDVMEIDVLETRQIPFVNSSKSKIKKRPDNFINKNPGNQHIFGKENINEKRRQETYSDAVHGNIKKDTRKIIIFTNGIPRLYLIIMSRTSFKVNLLSIVCMNVKELLARSRRHI